MYSERTILRSLRFQTAEQNHNDENQTTLSNYILHMPPGLIFITESTADRVSSNLPLSRSRNMKSVFTLLTHHLTAREQNEILRALDCGFLTHQNRQIKLI